MGEYANYAGQRVKIGTCEDMLSYQVTRRRDIEISGVVTDDDGEQWLTFFPTDKDGNQFNLGDPARKEDRIELALVESLYVY